MFICKFVTCHVGLQIDCEPEDGRKETSFRVSITNISRCVEPGPPYVVDITAGNAESIMYYGNGTFSRNDTTLSIRDHGCRDNKTFVFFLVTSNQTVNVTGSIVNVLRPIESIQTGKFTLYIYTFVVYQG